MGLLDRFACTRAGRVAAAFIVTACKAMALCEFNLRRRLGHEAVCGSFLQMFQNRYSRIFIISTAVEDIAIPDKPDGLLA